MIYLLEPLLTACDRCPEWELAVATEEEKRQREQVHAHAKHGDPIPAQEITGVTWQERAVKAVEQVASRGRDFRIYDALAEFGLQSPPDAQHRLGRFTTLVHDMGVAHKVRDEPSTRPGTKGSAAGVWNRDPARCVYPKCRVKAGAR